MKICTVLGARPQFIKAAVVSRSIMERNEISEVIIHTGQHFDANMSDVFFEEMDIPKPKYNLNINGLSHGAMTGQMLEKIEDILIREKPACVLVYGDTNSTLAGALAAKKMHIPVVHVEAGLRSFNVRMPEEVNRILTDRISELLFCPTEVAVANLKKEGYEYIDCKVLNSGDVMMDASVYYAPKARKPEVSLPKEFILCTIHRGENTDNPTVLMNIMKGLNEVGKTTTVVVPLHPRTRSKLSELEYDFERDTIRFINPVSYFEMIWLITNSQLVITDSGGLQKEAYFFKKNCLVVREDTEWTELVDLGYNIICGTDPDVLKRKFEVLKSGMKMDFDEYLYGKGNAGKKIVESLINFLKNGQL